MESRTRRGGERMRPPSVLAMRIAMSLTERGRRGRGGGRWWWESARGRFRRSPRVCPACCSTHSHTQSPNPARTISTSNNNKRSPRRSTHSQRDFMATIVQFHKPDRLWSVVDEAPGKITGIPPTEKRPRHGRKAACSSTVVVLPHRADKTTRRLGRVSTAFCSRRNRRRGATRPRS